MTEAALKHNGAFTDPLGNVCAPRSGSEVDGEGPGMTVRVVASPQEGMLLRMHLSGALLNGRGGIHG